MLKSVHEAVSQLALVLLVELWVSSIHREIAKPSELLAILDQQLGILAVNQVEASNLAEIKPRHHPVEN